MSETKLNKSFQEKDVRRLRNLISGKSGEKSTTGIGYKKKDEIHGEGDIWEENGKKYTIRNGIKITSSKLTAVKKMLQMPLCCPKCGNRVMDELVMHDNDLCTCTKCGLEYNPIT